MYFGTIIKEVPKLYEVNSTEYLILQNFCHVLVFNFDPGKGLWLPWTSTMYSTGIVDMVLTSKYN